MVFLAALFLFGGMSLNSSLVNKHSEFAGSVTVQIPFESADAKADAQKIIAVAEKNDAVDSSEQLDQEKVKAMVEPWLGTGNVVDSLPLPVIVEVKMKDTAADDDAVFESLRQSIKQAVPLAEVERNLTWIDTYNRYMLAVQWAVFSIALLVILVTTATIILATKTGLMLHHNLVMLLHSLGATDEYIARQFEINSFRLALIGSIKGTVLALVMLWILSAMAAGANSPLMPSLELSPVKLLVGFILPVFMAMLALLVSRRTVLSMLRQMP